MTSLLRAAACLLILGCSFERTSAVEEPEDGLDSHSLVQKRVHASAGLENRQGGDAAQTPAAQTAPAAPPATTTTTTIVEYDPKKDPSWLYRDPCVTKELTLKLETDVQSEPACKLAADGEKKIIDLVTDGLAALQETRKAGSKSYAGSVYKKAATEWDGGTKKCWLKVMFDVPVDGVDPTMYELNAGSYNPTLQNLQTGMAEIMSMATTDPKVSTAFKANPDSKVTGITSVLTGSLDFTVRGADETTLLIKNCNIQKGAAMGASMGILAGAFVNGLLDEHAAGKYGMQDWKNMNFLKFITPYVPRAWKPDEKGREDLMTVVGLDFWRLTMYAFYSTVVGIVAGAAADGAATGSIGSALMDTPQVSTGSTGTSKRSQRGEESTEAPAAAAEVPDRAPAGDAVEEALPKMKAKQAPRRWRRKNRANKAAKEPVDKPAAEIPSSPGDLSQKGDEPTAKVPLLTSDASQKDGEQGAATSSSTGDALDSNTNASAAEVH